MAAKIILQVSEHVEKALGEAQDIQNTVSEDVLLTKQNIVDVSNSLSKVSPFLLISNFHYTLLVFDVLIRGIMIYFKIFIWFLYCMMLG